MSSNQRFTIAMHSDPARGATRMSCVDAYCENERNGWVMVLDPNNAKHASALRWIHGDSGRKFVSVRSEEAADYFANHGAAQGITDTEGRLADLISRTPPGLIVLAFPPHQQCFQPHVDREVVFAHRDARANLRIHERFPDYREHWDEEADRVNRMVQRG